MAVFFFRSVGGSVSFLGLRDCHAFRFLHGVIGTVARTLDLQAHTTVRLAQHPTMSLAEQAEAQGGDQEQEAEEAHCVDDTS